MLNKLKAAVVRGIRWVGALGTSTGLVSVLAPTIAQSWWESHKAGYWYMSAAPLLAALSKYGREKWPNVAVLQWLPF